MGIYHIWIPDLLNNIRYAADANVFDRYIEKYAGEVFILFCKKNLPPSTISAYKAEVQHLHHFWLRKVFK